MILHSLHRSEFPDVRNSSGLFGIMLPLLFNRHMSPDAASVGAPQPCSSTSPWVRFTWKTENLPECVPASADLIRPATKGEFEKVLEVILNSLALDTSWNGSFVKVEQYLKQSTNRLFDQEEPLCFVLPKGNRLVAASLLDPSPEASSQLLSGPTVLAEYRNRGIGSHLLRVSLAALRDRGLTTVSGVTRANTIGARHVYAKFGGIGDSVQFPSDVEVASEEKKA